MFTSFIVLVGAYCVGSIPSGYWLTKHFFHNKLPVIDGQMGTKHVLEEFGFTAALLTFLLDFCKGYFPLWTISLLAPGDYLLYSIVFMGVILGHNYSLFLNFKGGKGIATSFGCLALFPAFMFTMVVIHKLTNELTKRSGFYGLIPLAILAFISIGPYAIFEYIPFSIRITTLLVVILFIIKTYDDPRFIGLRAKSGLQEESRIEEQTCG